MTAAGRPLPLTAESIIVVATSILLAGSLVDAGGAAACTAGRAGFVVGAAPTVFGRRRVTGETDAGRVAPTTREGDVDGREASFAVVSAADAAPAP